MAGTADELVCPSCGARYAESERFCANCNLPLTYPPPVGSEDSASELHRRARKVKPQLAEGRLVCVVGARNQAEAEFLQGLLLEEGVPSVVRRSAGFDVPDFLAAGPRDVLVPESGAGTAREILLQAEVISATPHRATVSPARLLVGILAALCVGVLIVWGISQLAG